MRLSSALRPKGLFGGLANELKVDAGDVIVHLSTQFSCAPFAALTDVGDWHRGGAETYVARGRVHLTNGDVLEVIGKAFVGFGLSPTDQQERWEKRRQAIAEGGVPVPRVYAQYSAMLIEEYIPDEMPAPSRISPAIAYQIGQIAHVLDKKGFFPVALLGDLRMKLGVVKMIDFGSDLGGRGQHVPGWESRVADLFSPESSAEFSAGFSAGFRGGTK